MPPSLVERCAERLGDVLVVADGLVARRGRRLLAWWRAALAVIGLGGLATLVVLVAPLPGAAAVLLLAVMGSLTVDGDPGSWQARGRDAVPGGEARGTGE
jgi:hypothetical protein